MVEISPDKREVVGSNLTRFTVFKIKTIDLIGVLKTVMHYGYSGISRETNLLSEEIDLYISQETFLFCSIPDTIP